MGKDEIPANLYAGFSGAASRIRWFCNQIIRYRYLLALIVFAALVLFKINGSSIGCWHYIVPTQQKTVLAGRPRFERSDEWEVQIPYYIAQKNSTPSNSLNNDLIAQPGQNMLVSYDAPVWDISALAKPLSWGFLLFNSDYGLAWYWDLKVLLFLLLSFEVCMILTRGNKLISVLGAVWITLSPAIQWWFMQHVGDIVLCMEAMIVTFYYFLRYADRVPLQIGFAALFSLSAVGFALTLYPAIQIPLAYLTLLLMIFLFLEHRRGLKHRRADIIIGICSVVFIGLMLLHVVWISRGAIHDIMDTVYPGHRLERGGVAPYWMFNGFLTNPFLPYKESNIPATNNCELSSFFNFLPAVLLMLPLLIRRRARGIGMGIALSVYSVLCVAYMFLKIPVFLAKITLLSYVTYRVSIGYGISAVYLSIWALGELSKLAREGKEKHPWALRCYAAGVAAAASAGYLYTVLKLGILPYVHLKYYLLLIAFLAVLNYLLARGHRKSFAALMCALALVAGLKVNTVSVGTGALTNTRLGAEVKQVAKSAPQANWLADGSDAMGVFLYANGVRSLSGVNYYPTAAKWKIIDPKGRYSREYNRYAHIAMLLENGKTPTSVKLLGSDSILVRLNISLLPKLGVRYVVSPRMLSGFESAGVRLMPISQQKINGYYLYRVQEPKRPPLKKKSGIPV